MRALPLRGTLSHLIQRTLCLTGIAVAAIIVVSFSSDLAAGGLVYKSEPQDSSALGVSARDNWIALDLDDNGLYIRKDWVAMDGDTLHGDNGKIKIRLYGIDAPEENQECIGNLKDPGKSWSCGIASHALLHVLVNEETIVCIRIDEDVYGRIVATCESEREGDIGRGMVKRGMALNYERFSHSHYQDEERKAREAKLGIWQSTCFTKPWDWRRDEKKCLYKGEKL